MWSGTISFGLVSVPVALYPANRSKRVALHMVAPDGTRLERHYFDESDKRLRDADLVHGYEVTTGKTKRKKMVVLEDDELERIAPERTRSLELQAFVELDEIDPMYFDRAYYLAPTGASTQAYRLLAAAMEETGRAGIATFVMRAKEHLAAVIAERGILRLETLHRADELRSPKEVGLPKPSRPSAATVRKDAEQIKRHVKARFDPDELVDESEQRLVRIAERKQGSDESVIEVPREEERGENDPDVIDLMARLQASIAGSGGQKHAKRGRKRA